MSATMTIDPRNISPTGRIRDGGALESERTYAMFNHLVGLLSMIEWVTSVMSIIATGLMWLIRKDRSAFLDDHGKEALNFQLSLLTYFFLGVILSPIGVGELIMVVGVPLLRLVGCIRGAIAAQRGEFYRYPMCIRFVR